MSDRLDSAAGPDPALAPDVLDSREAGPAAIRGGGLRVAGFAGAILLTLASAPLIFRHLGVVDTGRYLTVLSLVTLAAGLSEGGVNAIALREYATREGSERDRLLSNLLGIRITLTLAGLVAALGFGVVAGYQSALVLGTLLAGAGMFLQVLQTLLAASLQAELRFGWVTALELVRQATLVLFLVGLVLAGAGIVPLLAAQIPAGIAALALTVPIVRRAMPLRPRFERSVWWPLIKDTLPYTLSIAVNILYFRIAILAMSVASTGRETGFFGASFRITEVLIGIPPVVVAAAFPILARAARNDPERFAYATRRVVEVALIAGVWVTICVEILAKLAIDVLAGHAFADAIPVLRIQAPAIIATFLAVAATYPLLSLRGHREILAANAASLAVSGILLTLLVSSKGAQGAAVATLAAEVTLGTVTLGLLIRARPGLGISFWAFPAVGLAAAAALAAALLPGLPAVIGVVVATAVFFALLRLFGRFPSDLVQAVVRR
jgi:O-antigen/teichoic acid export membrane protein